MSAVVLLAQAASGVLKKAPATKAYALIVAVVAGALPLEQAPKILVIIACQGSGARWRAAGTSTHSACSQCAPGKWSDEVGAALASTCRACPAGRWSPVAGADLSDTCIACSPGKWSALEGASAQSACTECAPGTWSEQVGAAAHHTCSACPAGTYLPIAGAANRTLCTQCAVGNYSASVGVSVCKYCPTGAFGDAFGLTMCEDCSPGKWSRRAGAIRQDMCSSCSSSNCGAGASIAVTFYVDGVNWLALTADQRAELSTSYGGNIAAECGVGYVESIVLGPSAHVSCVLTVPHNSSASEVAATLRTKRFSEVMLQTTRDVLSKTAAIVEPLRARGVSVEPVAFVTTTVTKTSTLSTSAGLTTPISVSTTPITSEGLLTSNTLVTTTIAAAARGTDDVLSTAYGTLGNRCGLIVQTVFVAGFIQLSPLTVF